MISSLDKDCQISLGYGLPFLINPAVVSFLILLSMGAENLRPFTSLFIIPLFFLPKVSCLALDMLKPRNTALSLFRLVILVLVSLTVRRSSSLRNLDTLSRMDLQSTREPRIPITQSSAYRIYDSLLNFSSIADLEGTERINLCNLIFSEIKLVLAFLFSNFLYSGFLDGADPMLNSLDRFNINLSSS